ISVKKWVSEELFPVLNGGKHGIFFSTITLLSNVVRIFELGLKYIAGFEPLEEEEEAGCVEAINSMFKLHRQRAEKPSDKVDFTFQQFQATQVPISCDKLVVSIISVETGKAVARTNKALVRSGSCQWSEAVSESVRFLQDDISKEPEEKLFKFVVSMGSPRSGILGEATINLADYLSSKLPVPLSLPLKKCNHGTVLHVKIHCRSPRVGSRQSEHHRESTTEQDDQTSVSDDTDYRSEGSDHMIAGSSSGNRLGRGFLQNKDGASSSSSSRFSSDSGEVLLSGSSIANGNSKNVLHGGQVSPSDSENNLSRWHGLAGSQDDSSPNRTGNAHDSYKSSPSSPFNGKGTGSPINLLKQRQERSAQGSVPLTRGSEPSKGFLESAEVTIQEFRTEAMTWERNARKVSAELETLKHQFSEQTNHYSELEMELSAAEAERDSLKLEVEQVKSALQASTEKESALNNTRFDADDAKRTVKELQEEIELQKQSNANLDLQLRKTQESNMELVSALQELEETIQQQKIEIDKFSEERHKPNDFKGLQQEYEGMRLHTELGLQISPSKAEKDSLKTEVEELRSALQASMVNHSIGGTAYPKVENANFTIQKLQEEIEIEKASNNDLNLQLQKTEESYNHLVSVVQDLEERLKEQEMEIEHLSNANKRIEASAAEAKLQIVDVEAESLQKLSSKEKEIRKLAAQISSFEIQKSSTDVTEYRDESKEDLRKALEMSKREIDELERDCKELTDENMELIFKMNKLYKYMESKNISTAEVKEKQISRNNSTLNANVPMHIKTKTSRDEVEIDELKSQVAHLEACLTQFKNNVPELQNPSSGLETELERRVQEIASERDAYVSQFQQQLDSCASREKHLQGTIDQIECVNIELQSEIQKLKEEQRTSRSSMEELKFQFSLLTEEARSLRSLKSEFEMQASNLQMEKVDLEDKLQIAQEESKAAKGHTDELDQELARLTGSIESHLSAKRSLEKKAVELESTKEELERHLTDLEMENVQLSEHLSVLEAQLRYMTEEREAYRLDLENANSHGVELQANLNRLELDLRGENAELQKVVRELEGKLSGSLEVAESLKQEHEKIHLELDGLMKEYAESKEKQDEEILEMSVSRANTEEQLQELRGQFSFSVKQVKSLESELENLQKHVAEKERALSVEMESLLASSKENEQRALRAEEAFSQVRLEKATMVQQLENEVQRLTEQMSSTYDDKERMATKALIEASELRAEKVKLEDSLHQTQGKVRECEIEISSVRQDYETKVQDLILQIISCKEKEEEMNSREENADRQLEDMKLSEEKFRQRIQELEKNIQLIETEKRKLKEEHIDLSSQAHEVVNLRAEMEILRSTVEGVMAEKSRLENSRDTKEVSELREKLQLAEASCLGFNIRPRNELATLLEEFGAKEKDLCAKIGYLENVNKQFEQLQGNSREDHLQLELTRLQKENSSLSHREHELLSKLGAQELLQKEVEKLKEINKHLQSQYSRFKETKSGDMINRVLALETELAEALESNAMYKSQLKSFLGQEQNVHVAALQNFGSVDQVVNDLTRYKRTTSSLETELKDMRERYFRMSLQFAEVEAKREELVMQVKNLKNGKRWF
ncbi:hypothetical protein KI387_006269, partial [Taxus chinensis]